MARSVQRSAFPAGSNNWQSELPAQLTLSFEPSLSERFRSLREFVAYRVQEQRLNAAALAGKMDLSPTTLSRKLNQNEGDSQRLNCDDLEAYIAATGDVMSVIQYLAAKFSPGSDDARKSRAIAQVEQLLPELTRALATLRSGS
jgi:hypothetical protein